MNNGHKADDMFDVEETFVDVDSLLVVLFVTIVATIAVLAVVVFQRTGDRILSNPFQSYI